jgi:hypothetical protein
VSAAPRRILVIIGDFRIDGEEQNTNAGAHLWVVSPLRVRPMRG